MKMGIWTFNKLHQICQGGQYLSVTDLVISHAIANGILLVLTDSYYN